MHNPIAPDRLEADLALLAEGAREAGLIARRFFESGFRTWNKADSSPVTEADIAVDHFLREKLLDARDYGWRSEESLHHGRQADSDLAFVIDPIDGTQAFAKGRTDWAIAIALVHKGRPVAGVVYNVMEEKLYAARLGGGARLNDTPLRIGEEGDLGSLRLASENTELARLLADRGLARPQVTRCIAFAYRVCLVAENVVDASITFRSKQDWDVAAADIILSEAGGKVTDVHGNSLVYNRADSDHPNVIAAGVLHGTLQSLLEKRL